MQRATHKHTPPHLDSLRYVRRHQWEAAANQLATEGIPAIRAERNDMTPLKLAEGMAEEIKEVVYRYHESMPLATAIGVLEIVKVELMQEHAEKECGDE